MCIRDRSAIVLPSNFEAPLLLSLVPSLVPVPLAVIFASTCYWNPNQRYVGDSHFNRSAAEQDLPRWLTERADLLLGWADRLNFSPDQQYKDPFSTGTGFCFWAAGLFLLFLPSLSGRP